VLRHALDLTADPYALYRDASPEVRRRLNEPFYRRFYIDDLEDGVAPQVSDQKTSVFADLHDVARNCRNTRTPGSRRTAEPRNAPEVRGSNKALSVGHLSALLEPC
jgi:site-specific DNA recombinase